MKYRIKKVTYKDGEVKYFAQYYKNWLGGWKGIFSDGTLANYYEEVSGKTSRKDSLKIIDLVDAGKGIVVKIEFENINK